MPLFIPGVGSQGGDLHTAVTCGANIEGRMAIIAVSRDIIFAKSPHKIAAEFRYQINSSLSERSGA
jgi:orotidine-5'-phosphate decarboxylase